MSTIKIRSKRLEDHTLVRCLIAHPMETGMRKNEETGDLIPPHFIQVLSFKLNDKVMSTCQMGFGVSKNPFFSYRLKSAKAGDIVTISWQDNLDYHDSQDHIIK